MNRRLVAALLLGCLLTCSPAQASERTRAIYASVVTVISVLAAGCLATGLALRFEAPNADTLMTYKREVSAGSDLTTAGGIIMAPAAVFAIVGGLFLTARDPAPRGRVSLVPSVSGGATGLAVSF
jgi:hypothetical protein